MATETFANHMSAASPIARFAAQAWGWVLLRGVLALALGVSALTFPLSALFAFTLLFAAYATVDGIASLLAGIRSARAGERWGAMLFRGITGIAIDVAHGVANSSINASDFTFQVGTTSSTSNWASAPATSGITFSSGGGYNGADRITIT